MSEPLNHEEALVSDIEDAVFIELCAAEERGNIRSSMMKEALDQIKKTK